MITDEGPKTIEFNCRFGDPECQPILMRMKSDIIPVIEAAIEGRLDSVEIEWEDRATVAVVMAAGGYPGTYEKGKVITGLDSLKDEKDLFVFHAGTRLKEGEVVTNGGRVLAVTALGEGVEEAIGRAYEAVKKISWDGAYFRTDIGKKALVRLDNGK